MRVFTAGLATESNTFAPWPTGAYAFAESGVFRGDASREGEAPQNLVARRFRDLSAAEGHDFIEGLYASAEPSGPVVQAVYEGFRDEIVGQIVAEGPFDVVLLWLHGAMVSTTCDDCEGDLIAAIRGRLGTGAVIGAVLDPHCHLTPAMIAGADSLVLMKEYPHTDYLERAAELHRICLDAAARRTTPVHAAFDCRMLGFYPTTGETMRGFVERMRELEARAGILSVSFVHGFPWGDTADTGSQVLVVADGDRALAAATAETLGREIYAAREALAPSFPNLEDALDLAVRLPGRVVMADIADNAGGGAPGDNVSLLRAVRARALPHAVFGCVWDPVAAAACADAGVGARFPLRLGGKSGPTSGDPLDVEAVVRAISEAHDQTGLGSSRVRLGLSAWIEVDGVDVVVTSIRSQTFSPDAFTGLGVDLAGKRLIAVKSSQHFRTHFGAVADHVIQAATPGALQMDFAAIAYRKRRDFNVYPFVHAPLG